MTWREVATVKPLVMWRIAFTIRRLESRLPDQTPVCPAPNRHQAFGFGRYAVRLTNRQPAFRLWTVLTPTG